MLKPTRLSKREKDKAEYAGPRGEKRKSYLDTPTLATKKAQTLKTVADQPKEIVKSNRLPVIMPIGMSGGKSESKSSGGLKSLVNRAMEKVQETNGGDGVRYGYKKTEKVSPYGRTVVKEKGVFSREVDGRNEMVREKRKTVSKRTGIMGDLSTGKTTPIMKTKKVKTKGKGVQGSVIGRYKDVKRFKQ